MSDLHTPRRRQELTHPLRRGSLRGFQSKDSSATIDGGEEGALGGTTSGSISSSGGGVSSAAYFSSAGPTLDGRRKPDIMAPGKLV